MCQRWFNVESTLIQRWISTLFQPNFNQSNVNQMSTIFQPFGWNYVEIQLNFNLVLITSQYCNFWHFQRWFNVDSTFETTRTSTSRQPDINLILTFFWLKFRWILTYIQQCDLFLVFQLKENRNFMFMSRTVFYFISVIFYF